MINKNVNIDSLDDIFNEYKEDYFPVISDFTKIYTYYIDNKIVAFLIFNILYEKCEIVDIFVKPDYRRKNIASLLINEILNDYKLENITLEVSSNNLSALKLYEKLNFKSVAKRKNYYKDSDAILMLKEVR
jgi:ribosomal-protein-alanine N-acetyltransferase